MRRNRAEHVAFLRDLTRDQLLAHVDRVLQRRLTGRDEPEDPDERFDYYKQMMETPPVDRPAGGRKGWARDTGTILSAWRQGR